MPLEGTGCYPTLGLRSGCDLVDVTPLWPDSADAQSPSPQKNVSWCLEENSHLILCPVAPIPAPGSQVLSPLCPPYRYLSTDKMPWAFSSELKSHSAPSHSLQTGWCLSLSSFPALGCTHSTMPLSLLCWGGHSTNTGYGYCVCGDQYLTPGKKLLQNSSV